jgi:hypothetical protein
MTRSTPLIPALNAGEFSPRMWARADFIKYPFGLETALNVLLWAEGAASRRPGSRYISAVKDSSVKGRLKRFEFSTTQAYVLELGDGAMRFYRYQGQITVADTDAAISNGTFTSNITGWDDRSTGGAGNQISHDSTNGRLTLETSGTAADDIGWAEQDVTVGAGNKDNEHVIKFRVIGAPGDKIEFQVGTSSTNAEVIGPVEKEVGYHCVAFTPGATTFYVQFRNLGANADKDVQIDDVSLIDNAAVEVDTPWAEADLFNVEGPQSADILYLFHTDYPTHKLQRYGHTTWSLVEVAWQDGPWLTENATSTTLTFAAATGLGVGVTASSTAGINDGDGFKSTDVGRLIRLTDETTVNWGWAVITSVTNTTTIIVDVKRTVTSTAAETRWRLGSWSGTTGYPSAAAFFEQRLFVANNGNQPQTFWASQTADFENHAPDSPDASDVWDGTVEDDDALDYTISSDSVNAIRWLSAGGNTLAIGTTGGQWVPSSQGAVLTPSDISVRRQTTRPAAAVQPVRIDNFVLFVQRALRKIREFGYTFETDSYHAPDMTRLAAHVTYGGIVEMDFAEEPDSIVWAVRNDGQLLSMTYRREEDVVGWSRHVLGGSFGSGDPVVESIVIIPGADGAGQTQSSDDRDEIWLTVKRTINGSTVRYVEMLERVFEDGHDQEDAYYADSIITYDGAATTSITGLDHLEGETVKVWADGYIVADKTVASGTITLANAASVVQVGLGYTHTIKSLKLLPGTQAGTPIGKVKQVFAITFSLHNAALVTYGPSTDNLETRDFRQVSDAMDAAVSLFTGDVTYEHDGGWTEDPRLIVQSDAPAPFTLQAWAPQTDVKEQI